MTNEIPARRIDTEHGSTVAHASEYAALRAGAGLLDLQGRGILRLRGADRARFLNNLVTNDILALGPGSGCQAIKASLQGRMEAALRVLCAEDALWCDTDASVVPTLGPALVRRILRDDVVLEDVSEAWTIVALQGPQAAAVLARVGVETAHLPALHAHTALRVAGVEARVVKSDHTGDTGYDLWVLRQESQSVRAALVAAGAVGVGAATLEVRRVEAGIPKQGAEITSEHFPQEAGLEAGWISYTKGCYLGQETIARLHHLGHVNWRLCGIEFAPDAPAPLPKPGTALTAGGKEIGTITSRVHSMGRRRPIALAYVRRGYEEAGVEVEGRTAASPLPGQVVPLPFVPGAAAAVSADGRAAKDPRSGDR